MSANLEFCTNNKILDKITWTHAKGVKGNVWQKDTPVKRKAKPQELCHARADLKGHKPKS